MKLPIVLKPVGEPDDFILLNKRCVDNYFYATRAAVREAVISAATEGFGFLVIRHRFAHQGGLNHSTTVGVNVGPERVRFGCHTFSSADTKKILKWAKAK